MSFHWQKPIIYYYHGNQLDLYHTTVIRKFVGQYWTKSIGYQRHKVTPSWPNSPSKSAFQVSMATEFKFPKSVEFSDILVPSPSNRAIHEVSTEAHWLS